MKLIVGLGNPGERYRETRHNAGRRTVEALAESRLISFKKAAALKAYTAQGDWEGQSVALAVPDVYMNLSGESVAKLVEHFEINVPSDLLVVVDDTALLYGSLRLRSRGSDGGHNGMRSVERFLGTADYARLRMGVGMKDPKKPQQALQELPIPLEDYVLGRFTNEEEKKLPDFVSRACEACRLWAFETQELAMSRINAGF